MGVRCRRRQNRRVPGNDDDPLLRLEEQARRDRGLDDREQAREGVGQAALRLLLTWAFNDLGMERMEITALPENASVPHIAKKFGFTYEGTLRQRNLERGRRVDLLIWGLLRDEWEASGESTSGAVASPLRSPRSRPS